MHRDVAHQLEVTEQRIVCGEMRLAEYAARIGALSIPDPARHALQTAVSHQEEALKSLNALRLQLLRRSQ
jgi:hypothetical protein